MNWMPWSLRIRFSERAALGAASPCVHELDGRLHGALGCLHAFLRESIAIAALVLLSELFYVGVRHPGIVAIVGGSLLSALLWYLAAAAGLASSIAVLTKAAVLRSLCFSAALYTLVAIKTLAIDADFLVLPAPIALFCAISAGMFALLWRVSRWAHHTAVFGVFVLQFLHLIKWLREGWAQRGGRLRVFLLSWESILLCLAALAILSAAFWTLARYRRSGGILALSLAVLLGVGISVQTLSALTAGPAVKRALASAPGPRALPDLVILSFDALRKDAFDRKCEETHSPSLRLLCERSTHYENVVSSGIITHTIVKANIRWHGSCSDSLPGLLSERGYRTSMYFGRKLGDAIAPGCFDSYYSANGKVLFEEGLILSGMAFRIWRWQPAKQKGIAFDSHELLGKFVHDRDEHEAPAFAYFHFLDAHVPYLPSSLANDPRYISRAHQFVQKCVVGQCDPTNPDDKQLIDSALHAYGEAVNDIERVIERVFRLMSERGGPFRLVITADHGELLGEHQGFSHGGGFVPELLSVPFLVFDSTNQLRGRNCRLLSSAGAMAEATSVAHSETPGQPLPISGEPLGRAVIDGDAKTIEYWIDDRMLAHRGTWRNWHLDSHSIHPYPLAHCD